MHHYHDVVSLRAFMLVQPKRFADQPFDPVTANGVADRGGDGKTKPAISQLVGAAADGNRAGSRSQLRGEDGVKIASAMKPQSSRESV